MFKLQHRLQHAEIDEGGGGDPWYAPLAGDNETRAEALKQFETPDAFFSKYEELSKGGDTVNMEQFRKAAAGDNEDYQKALERYNEPTELAKALVEAKARIREGFKPEAFPAEGSDEDKAAWRERHSIPNEPAGYLEAMKGDIAIGEEDKPIFESFAAKLHERGMSVEPLEVAAEWYNEWVGERETAILEQDQSDKQAVDDQLTEEFGPAEYRLLVNNAKAVLSAHIPEADLAALMNGRLQDGKGFMNNPGVLKGLISMAKLIQPPVTVPGGGNDPGKSIDNRLAEIAAMRKKDHDAYMKNDAIQKEELELIEAQQRLKQS